MLKKDNSKNDHQTQAELCRHDTSRTARRMIVTVGGIATAISKTRFEVILLRHFLASIRAEFFTSISDRVTTSYLSQFAII